MEKIKEGRAEIFIPSEKKISKKLEVFYNPLMKLNRDISILLLNTIPDKKMQMADPLAGTGIRGIRFLLELEKGKIENLSFNDYKNTNRIRENLTQNRIKKSKSLIISENDANIFMLESKGFDYIDIDPFGSPNPFLDSAIVRLARKGILAVTATDTAALAGSSPSACIRKYWAKPLRNEMMHEIGIRILIRKVQLIGMQHEKALLPIFSYAKDHYYRIFFRCEKGKQKADSISDLHKYMLYNPKTLERKVSRLNFWEGVRGFEYAGPLWAGRLWDKNLAEKMYERYFEEDSTKQLLLVIKEEAKIDSVGFYDLQKLSNTLGLPIPKIDEQVSEIAVRTHFLGWGIRAEEPPLKKKILK